MLAQFPGNEGVDSVGKEVGHSALSASGKNGDALRVFATVFNGLIGLREAGPEFLSEFSAAALGSLGDDGDIVPFVGEEGIDRVEAEGFGEEGIVADFGVTIEGEVRTVNSEVVVEGEFDLCECGASEGKGWIPEEAVVAN